MTSEQASNASTVYRMLRWAYQPVKVARRSAGWLLSKRAGRAKLNQYLAREGFKGLHVGCGPFYLNGWINTDLYGARSHADFSQDITKCFECADEVLDCIYAGEVIEHLPRNGCSTFLREALRVLRPGGVLRLTTPDIAECCRLYLGLNPHVKIEQFAAVWKEGRFSPENWLNSQFTDYGHQHLFSFEELSAKLLHTGFAAVTRCKPQQTASRFSELRNLENRYGKDAPEWLWCRTMIVEATKQAESGATGGLP